MSTAPIGVKRIESYLQSVGEVLAALGTDEQEGLSRDEAQARLDRYGRNELTAETPVPSWRKFLAQFQDLLVLLLLVAAVISAGLWLYERDSALPYEAMAIFAVVLLNAIMGYIQQARAEKAVAALRQMSAAQANVIRDGVRQSIPGNEVVPGDLILAEEGDTIPADARLIESSALQTAEAALTGESLPVSKDVASITEEAGLGDRHNMLFSGTAATYGHGRAVVTATGMQTQMGQIATMLTSVTRTRSPLQRELDSLTKVLGLIAWGAVAVIVVAGLARGMPAQDLLLLGTAMAISAIPTGMPAFVSGLLSMGAKQLAASRAVVKNLTDVETLGATSAINTDKTGTLTLN
jgi:P-type Ca2+ transporter type 2C